MNRPRLANWGLRVLATLIDYLVVAVALYAAGSLAGVRIAPTVGLILWAALAFLEGTRGRTPGKWVVGTRTLHEADGQLLGFRRAFWRRFAHLLDVLACGVGYLWPLWDEKRQTFADKVSSSVVVKA